MIKIRFRFLPKDAIWDCFIELIEEATGETVLVIEDFDQIVDLEITGPYGGNSDDHKTPLS